MHFHIIILKPTDPGVDSLDDVREVSALGNAAAVRRVFDAAFPAGTDGYALEMTLADDPVTAVHLAVKRGSGWSESVQTRFYGELAEVCRRLRGEAFAVADNTRLAP